MHDVSEPEVEVGSPEPVGGRGSHAVVGFVKCFVDQVCVQLADLVGVVVVGQGVDDGVGRDVSVGHGADAEVPEGFVVVVPLGVLGVLDDGLGEAFVRVRCPHDGVGHHPEVLGGFDGVVGETVVLYGHDHLLCVRLLELVM